MDESITSLIKYALRLKASDIHFVLEGNDLKIQLRQSEGIMDLQQDIWNKEVFEYLKFKSGFDLTNPFQPQSGQFSIWIGNKEIYCRFSSITNKNLETGVLRLLNTKADLKIEELTSDFEAIQFFKSLIHCRQGLIISSGPTNSGKTTTLHAILHEIAKKSNHKIVSLEDPIEIEDESYLQLEINEKQGFTYDKGIEELMRHDPDIIFIGETRNAYTAKMVVRAALTGHLCLTTIHAKNGKETIQRLLDFGIDKFDLYNTLTCIMAQRLYKSPHGKECIYEILEKPAARFILENYDYPKNHKTLEYKIKRAVEQGSISDRQAEFDALDLQR